MSQIYKFLVNLFSISFIIVLIIAAGFFCVADRDTISYSLRYKHKLLEEVDGPRIVFVGGSNMRYSLISRMVQDSLEMNPVNTGVFAGFGLKFIIDDIKPYLKKGDVIVLASEYHQFYGRAIWGTGQLAQAVNVCPEDIRLMNWQQLGVLARSIPGNNLGKLKAAVKQSLFGISPAIESFEKFDGMNEYGDTFVHWNEPARPWVPDTICGNSNSEAIRIINEFNSYITGALKGKLLITFPPYPVCGYNINKSAIHRVENELRRQHIPVLGSPQDYVYADSLFFNSSYHLGRDGAALRTKEIIRNLRDYCKK